MKPKKLKHSKQILVILIILFVFLISKIIYATDSDTWEITSSSEESTNSSNNEETNTENSSESNETEENTSESDNVENEIAESNDETSASETSLNDNIEIYSEAVVLIDSSTGEILYGKNEDEIMYPASTTKVMTAILALEYGNLDDITTVNETAVSAIPSGYSTSYLSDGEEISVENLLKMLLIHSSNDAANVLAEYVSGSIEEFVNLMNEKAIDLGCTNTHFVNTNGIHNEDHYSTATDLAIITQYCMQNETFRELVSMTSCTIPATNKFEERTYDNTNNLLLETSEYYREDCIGVKTGFTSPAMYCLICSAYKDDMEIIAVILHSDSLSDRYSDASTLFDYGFKVLEEKEEQRKALYELYYNSNSNIMGSTETLNNFKENIQNIFIGYFTTQFSGDYFSFNLYSILMALIRDFLILMILSILTIIILVRKLNYRGKRESIN